MNTTPSIDLSSVLKCYDVKVEDHKDLQYYNRMSMISSAHSFDELPDLMEQTKVLHEIQNSGFSVFETDRLEVKTFIDTVKYNKCVLALIDKEEGFWMIWK